MTEQHLQDATRYPFHHVYSDGYSVLPKLRKLGPDDCIFSRDQAYADTISLKEKAAEHRKVEFESYNSPGAMLAIIDYIKSEAPWVSGQLLDELAMQLQEDICVVEVDGHQDWVSYMHVCFPSGWAPEDKIGYNFEAVHGPVPGMNLKHSYRMVESMINGKPLERYVFSVKYDRDLPFRLDYHPNNPVPPAKFDLNDPYCHLKIERQCMVGFKLVEAAIFTIRQYIVPFAQVDKPALFKACLNMDYNEKQYKGISEDFLQWLSK